MNLQSALRRPIVRLANLTAETPHVHVAATTLTGVVLGATNELGDAIHELDTM